MKNGIALWLSVDLALGQININHLMAHPIGSAAANCLCRTL